MFFTCCFSLLTCCQCCLLVVAFAASSSSIIIHNCRKVPSCSLVRRYLFILHKVINIYIIFWHLPFRALQFYSKYCAVLLAEVNFARFHVILYLPYSIFIYTAGWEIFFSGARKMISKGAFWGTWSYIFTCQSILLKLNRY